MSENGHHENGLSHLEFLRERHDELARDRTLELEVPGYHGRLVILCGAVPYATVARSVRAMVDPAGNPEALYASSADSVISACREVLYRGEDGALVPVGPDPPYRFDSKLAELFGAGTETARALLLWVYGGDDTAKARIGNAAGELVSWLHDVDSDATEVLVGE